MSKKKPTRCPDTLDIEEIIAAHKMREEQEAFDHQLFEKQWLEQLELYSNREPRKFELHLVKPNKTVLDNIKEGAVWGFAIFAVLMTLRVAYQTIIAINA